MLSLLLKAIDRVLDILNIRETRARLRYKMIFAPAFADLERVHSDYLAAFADARKMLQAASVESAAQTAHNTVVLIRERSVTLQPTRRRLATIAHSFREASLRPMGKEGRFTDAVTNYFDLIEALDATFRGATGDSSRYLLRTPGASFGYSNLLIWLEEFEQRVTANRRLNMDGRTEHDYLLLRYNVVESIDELTQSVDRNWITAARAFQALQLSVISRATKDL